LRALIYLALVGEQATADRISAGAHIPRRLLARVLARLTRAGLVESSLPCTTHEAWVEGQRAILECLKGIS